MSLEINHILNKLENFLKQQRCWYAKDEWEDTEAILGEDNSAVKVFLVWYDYKQCIIFFFCPDQKSVVIDTLVALVDGGGGGDGSIGADAYSDSGGNGTL